MIALIIAIGIAGFLLLYFAMQLQDDHFLLKLLLLFFVFGLVLLLPKAYMDDQAAQTCEVIVNSTLQEGNTTSYTYAPYCYTAPVNTHMTSTTFLKNILWTMRLFYAYIFLYLNWWFWLGKLLKNSRTWGKVSKRIKGGR